MAASIWKGSISFGLLNIPVSLQKAQQEKDLSFSMLDGKDLAPIKYKKVNGKTGHEVPWDRIVKGYEYEKGQYVLMNKEDFKAANPKATQSIDIEDFVNFDEIDLMFLEKPYYLVPQKSGIKGYYLLVQGLKKTNKVAIGRIVIRTKMHLVMIMAKEDYLILEMLRFGHEVMDVDEVDYLQDFEKPKFSPKEVKMAEELIEGMTAEWNPEQYKDTYHDDLMKVIKLKIKAGEGQEIDWELPKEERGNTGKVVDLMPLLRQSLEERRKLKSITTAKTSKTKKKTTTRKKAG
jgi:DNA end-binding protein Ku